MRLNAYQDIYVDIYLPTQDTSFIVDDIYISRIHCSYRVQSYVIYVSKSQQLFVNREFAVLYVNISSLISRYTITGVIIVNL